MFTKGQHYIMNYYNLIILVIEEHMGSVLQSGFLVYSLVLSDKLGNHLGPNVET
jgi:hypothetical protein